MAVITTRAQKGSPLSFTEVDANFTALNQQLGALDGTVSGASAAAAPGTLVIRDGSGGFAAGAIEALGLTLTGSSVPTNGVYLPSANTIGIAAAGNPRLFIDGNGQIRVAGLGSAAAPAIAFQGDTNTGIYSPGADQVAISTNGAGRLFVSSAGRVGVGVTPSYQFDVLSTGTAVGRFTGPANAYVDVSDGTGIFRIQLSSNTPYIGSATNNDLIFTTNNTEKVRITSAGLVGIGTSSPGALLDVKVASDAKLLVQDGNTTGNVKFNAVNNAVSANVNLEISASNTQFFNGGTERLRITSAGSVGIGTSSPTAKLQVLGSAGAGIFNFQPGNDASGYGAFLNAAGTALGYLGNGGGGALTGGATTDFVVRAEANLLLAAGTNLERLRITSAGLVGVGTSSVTGVNTQLEVAGAAAPEIKVSTGSANNANFRGIRFGITGDSLDYSGIRFQPNNGELRTEAGFATWGGFQTFYTNGLERLRITSAGLVGIGTSTPRGDLSIANNTSTATVSTSLHFGYSIVDGYGFRLVNTNNPGNTAAGIFSIQRGTVGAWSDALCIGNNGNVGIGTSTPSYLLTVSDSSAAVADYTAGFFSSVALGTGESRTWVALQKGSTYGGAVGGYLNQGIGGGLLFGTYNGTANPVERARIDSSGRLLVGTSSAASTANTGANAQVQIEAAATYAAQSIRTNSNDATPPYLSFGKSRGITAGSNTVVASNDYLGFIAFDGADGSAQRTGAAIYAQVDATPGANDMPGRLVFSTTADGASAPTERMRITNSGNVLIGATAASASEILNVTGSVANYGSRFLNSNASPSGVLVSYTGAAPNGTGNAFLRCDDTGAERATIRSNGGLANYSANDVNLSDRNVKKDIAPAAGTWGCLKEWEIVNFRYKDQSDDADLSMGVIAQQVAESCPEVVTVFQEAKEATETEPAQEERIGVKEQQMMWMAIKALQEAQLRIEALEAEVAALKGA